MSWLSRETQKVLVMEEGCGALAAGRGGSVQVDPPTRPGKPETGPQTEPRLRWEGSPLYRRGNQGEENASDSPKASE